MAEVFLQRIQKPHQEKAVRTHRSADVEQGHETVGARTAFAEKQVDKFARAADGPAGCSCESQPAGRKFNSDAGATTAGSFVGTGAAKSARGLPCQFEAGLKNPPWSGVRAGWLRRPPGLHLVLTTDRPPSRWT